jgi:GcrA cell cycle regulator
MSSFPDGIESSERRRLLSPILCRTPSYQNRDLTVAIPDTMSHFQSPMASAFWEWRMAERWTDAKLSLLKTLWSEGNTASAIAQHLQMSRAAVLGKIFRLRLGIPAQVPRAAEASGPIHRRKGHEIKRGKTLLELTNDTCRWPIGDPSKKSFHFCGEPGADLENGVPYCERHRQRAYNHPAKAETQPDNARNGWRNDRHRFSSATQTNLQRLFQVALARRVRT